MGLDSAYHPAPLDRLEYSQLMLLFIMLERLHSPVSQPVRHDDGGSVLLERWNNERSNHFESKCFKIRQWMNRNERDLELFISPRFCRRGYRHPTAYSITISANEHDCPGLRDRTTY